MIDLHALRDLRWWYNEAQALLEGGSPVTAMMERQNNYTKGAILAAGYDYGMPGKTAMFYGPDAGKERAGKFKTYVDNGAREYNAIRGSGGQVIGHYDPLTVDITAETRGGGAPDDDEDEERAHAEKKRYGKMSRRALALARKGAMHERVMAAYCGELGEKYAHGILVPETVKKLKQRKKQTDKELTTGIETKEKAETEVMLTRRKGPGRIASIYHLTPSGRALLAERSGKASLTGTPEIAMRTLVTSPPDDVEFKAALGRMQIEALEMLADASSAYTEVLAEEPTTPKL